MGKAFGWICSIFCKSSKHHKPKRIKSSTKSSYKHNPQDKEIAEVIIERNVRGDESASRSSYSYDGYAMVDYSHAEAVAAASATAAEAALLAAQAAVEVVRLTRSGRMEFDLTNRSAVLIQSHFRAYLARKALRALRSLVKLQALVRGFLVRKQAVDHMRRMHALLNAQAHARAMRILAPASSSHTTHSSTLDTTSNSESSEFTTQARIAGYEHLFDNCSSKSSSTRRREVEYPESILSSAYPDIPNYMAYTKSSEAKSRSTSVPKQRTRLDRSSSNKSRDSSRRPSPSRIR